MADESKLPEMSAEERRNSGLIVLLLLAQTYYKLLECSVSTASWFTVLDLNLNQSYFWTVNNITNLLKNHEALKDFPIPFEPVFPDLYPTTVGDCDWDMVAPDVERFLSTVQQYVISKGTYEPEKDSLGWIFVELFRPSVCSAIESAIAYDTRMKQATQRHLSRSPSQTSPNASGPSTAKNKDGKESKIMKRDKVFVSYSHKDKKFLAELLAHLKPLERAGRVSAWSDKQIQIGSQWLNEIQTALGSARVAVLLVTKDFLASDFIHDHELSPLLKKAETGGVAIQWVLLRDCNWKKTPLKDYQAAFSTVKPLAEMKAERDSAWVAICDAIETAANS